MITNIDKVKYDVKWFWDIDYNPNATIPNALPNCTTLAYGLIIADGHKPPVEYICNASQWETVLTNGWMAKPYDVNDVEVGDILNWKAKGHVATCTKIDGDKKILSSSFYTGEHGCSVYNGKYDTRKSFTTLKELNDWMLENYPTRYFHVWDINEEQRWVGGIPELILKHPLYSVERNTNKNQIEVLTFEQNVRNKNNEIVKKAEKGFFNVISEKEENGYTWYEVKKGLYIAGVNGRVNYLPKNEDDMQEQINMLQKENSELKKDMKEIQEIANKWRD